MASDPRRAPATKGSKRKPTTLDSFCTKKGAQGTEERGEEGRQGTSPKAAPPFQGENCPQALLELQYKVMRMEEIWQERWEAAQNRNLQLETEAQKSNEMIKARNEQLEAMTAENQSLKTRMEQMEARNSSWKPRQLKTNP